MIKTVVKLGDEGTIVPHCSEACMYMKIAGKPTKFKIIGSKKFPKAQLSYQNLIATVTMGEAGFYRDKEKDQYYFYQ